ncbi:MAG: helix-turn-helix transcriptional regulator [Microcoleus sp. PH2017_10_PVI_O_A]|uniref:helix-turn-helix transcriptional regulator n=1 Tax=unclassified Microcoleus TaxID=2642155 RepID=UPI001DFB8BBC|nr:helix-turn-helix transcriptional regulator [Microcoleus sp. PH2017_10_PVI_O_A]MCC3459276.1 helix-turn-helix transcriptional regulator [Microcoleus sp. PH2017_11_PCY_U_A]MCC3477409.1 helix-turn-helix transcriptional regulator [Microcoleus sp. PH2017_12_PCY_D_A]MCC3558502.1 helix-turn-helix transcriptional regulator [Microcoleus sp. PH2017_27_LUM_O_A]TAE84463.1 MAG: XRE family transcriptional regulator [Oscillatoriales cyanobacterium]
MTHKEKQVVTPVLLRKRINLTQRQASDLLGVRESTISEWERGLSTPHLLLVPKIMEVYACSADEVVEAFVNLRSKPGNGSRKTNALAVPNLEN